MPPARRRTAFFKRLGHDRRGAVGIVFALSLVMLVLLAGAAVDFTRAAQLKSMLQGTVDSAALSGGAVYVDSTTASAGTTVATNYMNNGIPLLPSNNGVTFTVTPGTVSSNGQTSAYTISISATAQVPTTLLGIFTPSIAVSVGATANNPVVTATFDTGGFVSYACDTNSVYWYVVPSGGGVPTASAVHLLWSNNNANPPSTATFQVTGSQHVAFALENVTGARPTSLGGCNYGNNAYGAHPGDTQWFYTSMQPPSASFNIAPGGANTGTNGNYETTQDCSLVVLQGTTSQGSTTFPSPPQGQCYSASGSGEDTYNSSSGNGGGASGPTMATEMNNAAPSASDLGGNTYQFNWNDMGGNPDTYNYGVDMQYQFSYASGSGSGALSLTQ